MNFLTQMSKYILYVSLVLNGILLIFLTGPVSFFLYLSVVINLALVWYSVTCLITIDNLEEDMVGLLRSNEEFLEQLEDVHSLELYYGDEQLQHLINHSKQLVNDFIDVQDRHFDVEVEDVEYDPEENETAPQEE